MQLHTDAPVAAKNVVPSMNRRFWLYNGYTIITEQNGAAKDYSFVAKFGTYNTEAEFLLAGDQTVDVESGFGTEQSALFAAQKAINALDSARNKTNA